MARKLGLFIFRVDHDGYEDGLCVIVAESTLDAEKMLEEIKEKHLRRFDDWQSEAWWQEHGEDPVDLAPHVRWRLIERIHDCIAGKPRILGVAYHVG